MKGVVKKQIINDLKHYRPSGAAKAFFWHFSRAFSRITFKCLKYNRLYIYHASNQHKFKALFYRFLYDRIAPIFGFDFLGTVFGETPIIYHQCIIINPNATFGDNVIFHGNNVVGQKNNQCPRIGNNVEFCIGSTALGNIEIADGCIVGANALVIKSAYKPCFLIGVPAKERPFGNN